jgi:hypothetical protein
VNAAAGEVAPGAGASWTARLTGSRVARGAAWFFAALLLALATWHIPGILPPSMVWGAPQNSLDNSWEIALHMAASQGLDFGRDVVFTYGPLGFLAAPLLAVGATSSAAYAYATVVQVALALLVLRAATRSFGLAFVALGLPLTIPDLGLYVAFFLCVWLLERDQAPPWWWLSCVLGAIAAVQVLVKLNNGLTCLVLFALAAWRLPPSRMRAEAILVGSFLVALVVLWLATGNPVGDLPEWVRHSQQVVSGYTDAMALEDHTRRKQYVLALLLLAGAAAVLVPRLRSARDRTIPLVLAACVYAFAFLKEGFVRHDAHDTVFFCAFALGVLAFRWRGWARYAAAALVLGGVVGVIMGPEFGLRVYQPITLGKAAVMNVRDLVDVPRRDSLIESRKLIGRQALDVSPRQLALLRGHTVDVVPVATAAAWSYGLDWKPEPLLQWYMAYNAALDRFNADALAERGAERILRSRPWAVDGKEPAFEAPATYLAFLCHYRELASDARWEVLARTENRCGRPRSLRTVEARAGETISVPQAPPGELVYATMRFRKPILGRLESLLFKPVHLPRITLDRTVDERFIPDTAQDPLVMRVPPSVGMSPLFDGIRSHDTLSVRNVPSPFTVEFTAVPLSGSPWRAPKPPTTGRLEGSDVVLGGRRYPIVQKAVEGFVETAGRRGTTALVTGWAADAATAAPAERVAVFADGRLVAVSRDDQARPDVQQVLGSGATDLGYGIPFSVPRGAKQLRVFAIAGGKASELAYPPGYPWSR